MTPVALKGQVYCLEFHFLLSHEGWEQESQVYRDGICPLPVNPGKQYSKVMGPAGSEGVAG